MLRPALKRFRSCSVLGKVATVAVFCALAWCGGGKNDGDRGSPNPVNPVNPVKNNLRDSASLREISHDDDGNMTDDGVFSYTYDSASRLVSVTSNDILLVTSQYDSRGRRVRKITQTATHVFFYDDWNLIYEHVANTNGTVDAFQYFWCRDLSGALQDAGGVGGLLYLKHNGTIYVPHADATGNILRYTDTAGNVVASYTYDAFGMTVSQSGPLADIFRLLTLQRSNGSKR